MTRTWQATDGLHWASDSLVEQFGNMANYNVVDGCAPSYSGANMNVTVAGGTITHNGSQVTVAGGSVALVADGFNPRYSWVCLDSSGTVTLVSGTAAAEVGGERMAEEPEVGDNVEVALVYISAGGTIASAQSAVDRRMFAPRASDTDAAVLEADDDIVSTTLGNVTGLAVALEANTSYIFRALIHYTAAAAADYKFSFTVPASAVIHAMCTYTDTTGSVVSSSITSSGSSVSANGFGASTPGVIEVAGSVITAGTSGNLQYQHAAVVVSGTPYTKAKSRIELF